MFLSGNIIAKHGGKWITPFDPKRVDCAAYEMRVGDEAFVSPELRDSRKPGLFNRMNQGSPVMIPPGQFAFLTTREFVSLPHDFLGFINMKSGLKNSGLVNVSGFHVDPGYKGKLLFAVYNAGPATVTVRCDQAAFLIWFARLDGATEAFARKKAGFKEIETTLMGLAPAELLSLRALNARMDKIDSRLGLQSALFGVLVTILTGIVAGLIYTAISGNWGS
ncbi:dUTP pyrophosphatase [Paracoccus sp. S4493]|uniref:dCTP deaminase n=1 Tax=Paracoccus sp. S4493 TaxID=579490 RepID=UPI0005FA6262|nr:dUTP pyrophosphatase [Paracoccus sp. S4493]KJZ29893.1 dUTP pyrophosphatase [Paracoccus sp. S4493]